MTRRRLIPVAVVAAVLLAAVIWYVVIPRRTAGGGIAASGTVEATEADLGFQVGGRIRELSVREGDVVAAGQVIAELEAGELEARRAAAQAQVEGARALLAELERGARPQERRQAEAGEAAARERVEEAQRLYERARVLEAGGAVSRESLDQTRTALEVVRAQHAQAREQLGLVRSGTRTERVAAQRAAVRQAEAALAQADAVVAHAQIRAPFAGTVTVRHRQPGEAVGAGAPVVSLMDPADRWVRIYVREDAVGRVSLGQQAEIRTDSERDRAYRGRVAHIASQAEFTPRNVQTAEERVKLVYAVRVAIDDDTGFVLKPGMPADVVLRVQ